MKGVRKVLRTGLMDRKGEVERVRKGVEDRADGQKRGRNED